MDLYGNFGFVLQSWKLKRLVGLKKKMLNIYIFYWEKKNLIFNSSKLAVQFQQKWINVGGL